MEKRQDILAALKALMPDLQARFGVLSLALFGSAARDQAGGASDVDVLVSFAPGAPVTLLTLGALANLFEDALGRPVDVVEDHPRLRPEFRAAIQRDLCRVA